MARVELSADGQSALVNGTPVARAGVAPEQWQAIEAAANAGGRAGAQQRTALAGSMDGGAPPAPPSAAVSLAPGSGGRGARRATARDAGNVRAAQEQAANAAPPSPMAPPMPATPMAPVPAAAAPMPQRNPVRIVPVTNTSTTTSGLVGADVFRAKEADLETQRQNLAIDKAQQHVEESDIQATALRTKLLGQQKALADVKLIREAGDEKARGHMAKAQERYAQAAELQEEGHDFWQDRGWAMRLMAVVASAASGYAAGMRGEGGNPFLKQLQGMMAREDRLHQQKIDGMRKDARGEVDFYDMARTVTNDEVAQRLVAEGMMLDAGITKYKEMLEGMGDTRASMQLQEAVIGAQQQKQTNDIKLADHFQTAEQTKHIKVGGGKAGDGQTIGIDGKVIKNIPGTRITDEQAFANLGTTERASARELSGAANALYNGLTKMAEIRERVGTESYDSKDATDYKNLAYNARVDLSQLNDAGVITKEDAEQMDVALWEEDLSPKMSDVTRLVGVDVTLNKILSAKDVVESKANNKLRAMGLAIEGLKAPNKRLADADGGFAD